MEQAALTESLRDISNNQAAAAPTLKTFARRKKASVSEDPPGTPGTVTSCASPLDDAPTTCSSSASCSESQDSVPTWVSSRSSVLQKGRRSSILHAVAVPGHESCREVPASRSIFLQKMSKARRKAYLAYTKQMTEYFAEVDEFELLEESPRADAVLKTISKRVMRPADGTVDPPFAHQPTQAHAVPQQQWDNNSQDATPLWEPLRSVHLQSEQSSLAAPAESPMQQHTAGANDQGFFSSQDSKHAPTRRDQDDGHQEQPAEDTAVDSTATAVHCLFAGNIALTAATPATSQHTTEQARTYQQFEPPSPQQQYVLQEAESACESPAGLSLASCTPAFAAAAFNTTSLQQQPAANDVANDTPQRLACAPAVAAEGSSTTPVCLSLSASALNQKMQQLSLQEVTTELAEAECFGNLQQRYSELASATPASSHEHAVKEHRRTRQQPCKQLQEQQLGSVQDLEQHQQAAEQAAVAFQQCQHIQQLEVLHMEHQLQQPWLQQQRVQQQGLQQDQPSTQQLEEQLQRDAADATAQQLAELELAAVAATQLTPLQHMLHACNQPLEPEMIPSMKEFMASVSSMKQVVKLGEGTYGEAFKAPSSGIVFKLVPMEGDNLINGYEQKKAGDLLAEAIIASTLTALSEECDPSGQPYPSHTCAFVKTHKVGVCRGPYPQLFIKAWRAWDKRNTSENDPVADHPKDQLYAVFAMADCGRDLEGYQLRGFDQARSMMLQVALALAIAEDCLAFEHRDLHWGNVMLTPATSTYVTSRFRGSSVKVRTEGVAVSLIDFTASRLQTPAGDVAFCDLEAEEGIFDGPKGKAQFETYRRMRKVTGGDWSGSHPATNVMWMLYLAELLLSTDKPIPGATAGQKRELRNFKKRVTKYNCCGELIWDELFQGLWNVV